MIMPTECIIDSKIQPSEQNHFYGDNYQDNIQGKKEIEQDMTTKRFPYSPGQTLNIGIVE